MKKITAMIILMVASMNAYAGSSSQHKNAEEINSVVTPSFANGMWRTSKFANDTDMNLVICKIEDDYSGRDTSCKDKNGKNAWVRIENAVPKGKSYVGFKSVTQGSSHYIEIYWKYTKQ